MKKKLLNYFLNSGSIAYSSAYQQVLIKATALGYTAPSDAEKVKQNTLLTGILALWNADAIYVFANSGSANFGLINWVNATVNLATITGTPTFTSKKGFRGVSGANIKTVPRNLNASQNSVSRLIALSDWDSDTGTAQTIHDDGSGGYDFYSPFLLGTTAHYLAVNQAGTTNYSPGTSLEGLGCVWRVDSGNIGAYLGADNFTEPKSSAGTPAPNGTLTTILNADAGGKPLKGYNMNMWATGPYITKTTYDSIKTLWDTYFASL